MKKRYTFLFISLLFSGSIYAQSNYVANAANAFSPGSYNTFIGPLAGVKITSGNGNSFVGLGAGYFSTTGNYNSFVGTYAGYLNASGSSNSFMGYYAGANNTSGSYNSFMGLGAGYRNTTGYCNIAIGTYCSYTNTAGHNNVMVGDSAGFRNIMSGNTFIGSKSGYSNATGTNNTFFGYQSGKNVTTGSNNILIGPTSGTAITDGNDNILMGYNSQATDGLHNAIAIGSNAQVASSNALILGNNVNVGIGTSAPTARLEVVGEAIDQSGLRLTQLTTKSQTGRTTDEFLTVDEQGNVIKARYQVRINDVNQWSDRVFGSTYRLRPLSEVSAYVHQQAHLPGFPSADQVQREGIDLSKLASLLLEKIEELTLYTIQLEKRDQQQQGQIKKLEQAVQQFLKK